MLQARASDLGLPFALFEIHSLHSPVCDLASCDCQDLFGVCLSRPPASTSAEAKNVTSEHGKSAVTTHLWFPAVGLI